MERDYGKIMLVSQSGKGKTYSFRNMDEKTTGFINTELKPLPFKKNFMHHAKPKKMAGIFKAFEDFSKDPNIDCIVMDSFSAAAETILEEMQENFTKWDIWTNYNIKIRELLKAVKLAPKEVILTAHYEMLNIEGGGERRVKVKGKEWEGLIEKEFTLVLYGDSKFKDDKPTYFFRTAGEGMSAKVPPEIFGEGVIILPNDSAEILKKVKTFYTPIKETQLSKT
jgi:hypothetical protein